MTLVSSQFPTGLGRPALDETRPLCRHGRAEPAYHTSVPPLRAAELVDARPRAWHDAVLWGRSALRARTPPCVFLGAEARRRKKTRPARFLQCLRASVIFLS